MYNEEKTAQMAGYFLRKHSQEMDYLKLMKLLYLADRKNMELYGESMSGDTFVSMKHGPVLSCTFDRIKEHSANIWHDWVKTGSIYFSVLLNNESNKDFDELSKSETRILDDIYDKYAHRDTFDLVKEIHEMCKEWRDPGNSSTPISYESIFMALGDDRETAIKRSASAREKEEVRQFLASMA